MKEKTKICVFTGTRAEFGLLSPLMKAIRQHDAYELQVLVSGMHLSPEFGSTFSFIEAEGFTIDEKVEMLLSSDSDTAIVKSTGLGMIGYADALARLKPDAIVILGDRFEAFAAATAAYLQKIPIIHLHGGEVTAGATDEALRHSITKMASLHFTSTEKYRQRVLQLGEAEDAVFNVGAIGIDNVRHMKLLDIPGLEAALHTPLHFPLFLITYHPVTLEAGSSAAQMQSLLQALEAVHDGKFIFTLPNADANGRVIIGMIQDFVSKHAERAAVFSSLGQLRYLSLMKLASVVVGNSSSGIIEAPGFGVPTVNIGDRQKGREAAASVIHCAPDAASIAAALQKALGDAFREACRAVENPYGSGGTTERIMEVLGSRVQQFHLKKEFIDRI